MSILEIILLVLVICYMLTFILVGVVSEWDKSSFILVLIPPLLFIGIIIGIIQKHLEKKEREKPNE